ncbi:hypothetical protein GWD52_11210 [Enterobacteriaceae bacterium 4M9]|nr:hypothetical protein [Enterobacteriaceae bacterium 4M9]
MNSSENEQLTDVLIGEAVLFLLRGKSPVTTRALISRLRAMLAQETDVRRREALKSVIVEISARENGVPRQNAVAKAQHSNKDNVLALPGTTHCDISRKH